MVSRACALLLLPRYCTGIVSTGVPLCAMCVRAQLVRQRAERGNVIGLVGASFVGSTVALDGVSMVSRQIERE